MRRHRYPRLRSFFEGSIRSRLIFSYAAVAVLAVLSALIAMVLLLLSQHQTRRMLVTTLPIVVDAQNLGQAIHVFSTASRDVPSAETSARYQQLLQTMDQGIREMNDRLGTLGGLGIDQTRLQDMGALLNAIRANRQVQMQQAEIFLLALKQQHQADAWLRNQQQQFADLIKPRIAGSYRTFIEYSQQVRKQFRELVKKPIEGSNRDALADSFVINLQTLIGTAVGEMWANHELTSATYRAFSLLLESEIAATVDDIAGLQETYKRLGEDFERLQLVLNQPPDREDPALTAALALYNSGTAATSLFRLRILEVDARNEAYRLSMEADRLARSLAEQASMLTEQLRTRAAADSEKLTNIFSLAGFAQLMLMLLVVTLSIALGWYYVGRRLISRINSLKDAMDGHAMGMDVEIPLHGADEITDMAQALQCFVNQRATVETELRHSLDSLNEAQLIASLGSCSWDERRARWRWSDGFFRILGFEPGEFDPTQQTFMGMIEADDRRRVEHFFEHLAPSARIFELDFAMRRKDGSRCFVTTRWKYTKIRGKITSSLSGTVLDITERQQIEEELLKVRKLESIGVLAGGIAHDFNNLLTVIMGNAALARRALPDDHPVQQNLRLSENAVLRARDLTQRLLTFAKGGEPIRSATDLRSIISEAVEFVLHGSNVKCVFDIPETLWMADVDPGQMAQVIHNLAVNARQAMPEGGMIKLSCANVVVRQEDSHNLVPGDYISVVMADQGHGIAGHHLKRIFDPYFTTRDLSSTKGSGLGLAIVHSIIRKHGGVIKVESTIGRGTTFTIFVPAKPDGIRSIPEEKTEMNGRTGLVLVMDDEDMVRDVARSMLEHLGFEVVLAVDGQQAVARYCQCLAEGRRPDLVLMDLTVPGGVGGEKAAQRLLEVDETARIIVSSGYSNNPVMERYEAYGFCAIAEKPYQLAELSEAIGKALASTEDQPIR